MADRATLLNAGLCIGCGACAAEAGRMAWDAHGQLKPQGPVPPHFAALCPFSPEAADETQIAAEEFPSAEHLDARLGRYASAWVGHVAGEPFRANGSSGGLVSWVAAELLRRGLVDGVAHVAPATGERLFAYRISRSVAEVMQGAKSRYYPVDLTDVLREIRTVPGRYAVVGIPCFIKTVHLQRRVDAVLARRIVATLGLFCGHMKSARMVESFALQMGLAPEDVAAVEYRVKDVTRPANCYTAEITTQGGRVARRDWWNMADGDWGAGFFQNAACNFCDDVVAETADISFGDAWVEPYSSDRRGTNVVVVRSGLMQRLVAEGRARGALALEEADADFVASTQAAGFRQRREGLALRLALRRLRLRPVKRVAPGIPPVPLRRLLVYVTRMGVSWGSHRMFRLARVIGRPGLYLRWATASLALYQGLTWSCGRIGHWADRLFGKG